MKRPKFKEKDKIRVTTQHSFFHGKTGKIKKVYRGHPNYYAVDFNFLQRNLVFNEDEIEKTI